MSKTSIKVRPSTSVIERIREKVDLIRRRAFERFQRRGADSLESELDDWLGAEREFDGPGSIALRTTEEGFEVEAVLPGMEADNVSIEATPDDILVTAERRDHHHGKGSESVIKLIRAVHLPAPIDLERVKADYKEGVLRIKAVRAAGLTAGSGG